MPLFSNKPKKTLTRLFFATDLHGSERTYRKFINAGKFYEANVLVMGGDITGKLLIPIIKESGISHSAGYRATLQGHTEHFTTEAELHNLLDRLATLGFYNKIMTEDEFIAIQGDPVIINNLFHDPG
jgi:Icc-related predicted phosphoesterase